MKIFIRPRKSILLTAFLFFLILSSKFSFAQLDLCTAAPVITSAPAPGFCTTGTLAPGTTYTAGGGVPGACGGANNDVWFKFVAQSTKPIIAYTAGTLVNGQIQLFSGACGGLTSIACGPLISATGLTIGTTYYIRIYSTSNATGTFTVCITDPPVNDLCANAVSLASASTCVNTTGSVINASYTGPLTDCLGATPTYDVWYSFVAQTTSPTITVNIGASGSNISLPKIQLFSGSCAGLTSISCSGVIPNPGSGSINATGLTVGNTYFVRLYSPNAIPTTNGTFSICVTDPAPANNDCGGAVTLTPGGTCTNTGGTVISSTLSSGVPLPICGTPVYDVWYKFVAASTVQAITLSAPTAPASGTNFLNGNQGIQLLSGACGSLSNVTCATGSTLTAPSLTIGTTYYVRVYSTSAAVPTSNGAFNICVLNAPGNDDCSGAVSLTSALTCTNIAGTLTNATYTTMAGACGGGVPAGNRNDVWYSFVAQSTNPSIKLTSAPSNASIQLFSGTCASPTPVSCVTTAATSATLNATGLTVGTTYLVRIFSNNNTAGNFNICIQDPAPANDLCGSIATIASSTSCTNTQGTVYGATNTAVTIQGDCAGAVVYDVWYKFVAQTTNPTITLSSIGSNFTNPGMELLSFTTPTSPSCGTLVAVACGTTSISANFLTPGNTYYIRVFSTSGVPPTSGVNAGFNICVVDPMTTPPFNDDCGNAINLPVGVNTCSNLPTTIAGATASSVGVAPCTGPVAYDVWYKFKATSNSSTITLSGTANNFTNRQLQIFSGTCGSLVSIACGTTTATFVSIAGTTYYVRVYSTTGPSPNGNADFNICVNGGAGAPIRFGNSYVNVTKKTNGGVIEPGDILEIRMTINNTSGLATQLRFVDNVPSKTAMLSSSTDSIRIITNEGLTYKKYTVAADADAATYKASPGAGEYNIRLNLGFVSGAAPNSPTNNTNSSLSANGQMNSGTDKPKGGGGMLFAIAYRVKVTGLAGDTVTLFPAQFIYNNGTTDITLAATPFKMLISNPLNLCANSTGLNNAVENGGTFGSGTTLNRSTDLTTPIAGYTYVPNVSATIAVNDGRYGIVKNMSPRSDPIRTARRLA